MKFMGRGIKKMTKKYYCEKCEKKLEESAMGIYDTEWVEGQLLNLTALERENKELKELLEHYKAIITFKGGSR